MSNSVIFFDDNLQNVKDMEKNVGNCTSVHVDPKEPYIMSGKSYGLSDGQIYIDDIFNKGNNPDNPAYFYANILKTYSVGERNGLSQGFGKVHEDKLRQWITTSISNTYKYVVFDLDKTLSVTEGFINLNSLYEKVKQTLPFSDRIRVSGIDLVNRIFSKNGGAKITSDIDNSTDAADAATGVPDAASGVPDAADAAAGVPDAAAGVPDAADAAAPTITPDAAAPTITPDAATTGVPDAAASSNTEKITLKKTSDIEDKVAISVAYYILGGKERIEYLKKIFTELTSVSNITISIVTRNKAAENTNKDRPIFLKIIKIIFPLFDEKNLIYCSGLKSDCFIKHFDDQDGGKKNNKKKTRQKKIDKKKRKTTRRHRRH